ncbi:MAG: GTP pyrophosphokinase family protein [Clostridia bacterium]|nr:GTP pyrophosphokinase family protein [Clostridia bacterium]
MNKLQREAMEQLSIEFQQMVDEFFSIQCRYQAAIREVKTKLEILDDEFQARHKRNPIHHMQTRMKSIQSMMEKLRRRNESVSISSAVENLMDIAGVRVICSYIEDIYTVADLLTSQDDVKVIRVRDYIREPKANGYRSLHLVIEIPVFLAEGRVMVPVEVQIRTIAMDFWASLEHSLRYKGDGVVTEDVSRELQQIAEDIAVLDQRMQRIHDRLDNTALEKLERV